MVILLVFQEGRATLSSQLQAPNRGGLPRTKRAHFVDTGIERIESVRHTDPFQSAFRREASGKLDVRRTGYRDTQRAIALPRMVVQHIPVTPAQIGRASRR